jgi:hypothetical protein
VNESRAGPDGSIDVVQLQLPGTCERVPKCDCFNGVSLNRFQALVPYYEVQRAIEVEAAQSERQQSALSIYLSVDEEKRENFLFWRYRYWSPLVSYGSESYAEAVSFESVSVD